MGSDLVYKSFYRSFPLLQQTARGEDNPTTTFIFTSTAWAIAAILDVQAIAIIWTVQRKLIK